MSSPQTAPQTAKAAWAPPYYVKGLALGVPIYLVAIHMWTWLLIVPSSLANTGNDFRQIYAAGFIVRSGRSHELYVYNTQKEFQDTLVSYQEQALPFVSPAYEALLVSPLTFFRFRTAYFLFLAINIVALGFCFILLGPWMSPLQTIFKWLPIAVFLGFLPVGAALVEGQDSVVLMTLLAGAFVCLAKGRSFLAGLVTGLGFFKFPIVLPIAVLFLIWRRWRFLGGFVVTTATVVCTSVALTGIAQTKLYVETLLAIAGLMPPTSPLAHYSVKWPLMANIHGLMVGLFNGRISPSWLHAITILLSGLLLVWTAFRGLRTRDTSNLLIVAIPCSVLVGHHTYIHDLSVLLVPVVVLLNRFLTAEPDGQRVERRIARFAALMFVAPVVESFSPEHFYVVALAVLALLAAGASALSLRLEPPVSSYEASATIA